MTPLVPIRVAVIDMYNGVPNEGMRCIRDILRTYEVPLEVTEFEARTNHQLPDTGFDIYLSSGGPGSPFDMDGVWDKAYFQLVDALWAHNASASVATGRVMPKYMFFICHSYQLACLHFKVGKVCTRKSTAFGIMPMHKTSDGERDPLLAAMPEPFLAVESRDWQVIHPDRHRLHELGAQVLCLEKIRPHIRLERAMMAIRFSPYMVGTQFHPEADAAGMKPHFTKPHMREKIIRDHGLAKYDALMDLLEDLLHVNIDAFPLLPTFVSQTAQVRAWRAAQG